MWIDQYIVCTAKWNKALAQRIIQSQYRTLALSVDAHISKILEIPVSK